MKFEWDERKNKENIAKHGLSFYVPQKAFYDERRVILVDKAHSISEHRYFCIGNIDNNIVTVRFTMRDEAIRIFGAGYWRKGRKIYEERHNI
ncbi:MAG: BrnT family toxin [Clostridiales Family XIII bacterium]|jgi:uncharacterized DUF497 family protein|nr:BrnT family toxin [Clostridiales Family XIII bacterium]